MKGWGCVGFALGALVGLLVLAALVLITRPVAPPARVQPPGLPPDATIVVSEATVSRLASESVVKPVRVEFDPGGQMRVTTRTYIGRFEPVVQATILLEMQGADVASELLWVKIGFISLPARWLPQEVSEPVSVIGETIRRQTPPDFALVGLNTTDSGIEFRLKWVGR